jgi:spermidine/putrescine transport system permease protein
VSAAATLGARRRDRPGGARRWPVLAGYYAGLLALLYLPLAILVLFSLNANTSLSFPLRGLTLDWYQQLFEADAVLRSARNSLVVALLASVTATALGTGVALLVVRFTFRAKAVLLGLSALPLIVPFIVLGVALFVLFRAANIQLSLWTIVVGHTVVALPYTVLIVLSRLVGFDRNLEDAAMDLGASYPATLRLVVLPIIAPAMVSAALTAFTVSFDEFAIALFLAGPDQTFPVYLYSSLRFANRLPILIAMGVLVMMGTLVLVLVAERVRRLR